jgi:hypothetical protein
MSAAATAALYEPFVCLFVCGRHTSFTICTRVRANEQSAIPESLFGKRTNPCELACGERSFA